MCSFLCLVLWAILLLIGLFALAAVILWCETFQTKSKTAGGESASQASPQAASKTCGMPAAVTLPAVAVARPFADSHSPQSAALPSAVALDPVEVARPFAGVAKQVAAPPAAVHLDPVEVARPFADSDDDGKKL